MSSQNKTRRSISVAGKTYGRLHAAQAQGLIGSISGFVERLICAELDRLNVPLADKPPPRKKRPDLPPPKIGSGIHSF